MTIEQIKSTLQHIKSSNVNDGDFHIAALAREVLRLAEIVEGQQATAAIRYTDGTYQPLETPKPAEPQWRKPTEADIGSPCQFSNDEDEWTCFIQLRHVRGTTGALWQFSDGCDNWRYARIADTPKREPREIWVNEVNGVIHTTLFEGIIGRKLAIKIGNGHHKRGDNVQTICFREVIE